MPKKIDLTGKKIGRITFLKRIYTGKKSSWEAICDCGKSQTYRIDRISVLKQKGKIFECTECKFKRRSKILIDGKYGRLTVIGVDYDSDDHHTRYWCRCDCGIIKSIIGCHLNHKTNPTRSCGCFMRKLHSVNANTTQYPPSHGFRKNMAVLNKTYKFKLYCIRTSLAGACYKKDNRRYCQYGALGYTLCDNWRNGLKDFEEWAILNGYKGGMMLAIKEGKKEYSPENCYFTLKSENSKIKNSIFITYNGMTKNMSEWGKYLGVSITTISNRYNRYLKKYGIEKVMDIKWIPVRNQKYRHDEKEKEICKLYQQGLTYKKITEKIGASATSIKRFLSKNNILIRHPVQTPPKGYKRK